MKSGFIQQDTGFALYIQNSNFQTYDAIIYTFISVLARILR